MRLMLRSLAVRAVGFGTVVGVGVAVGAGCGFANGCGGGGDGGDGGDGDANSARRVLVFLDAPCCSGVRGLDMLALTSHNP